MHPWMQNEKVDSSALSNSITENTGHYVAIEEDGKCPKVQIHDLNPNNLWTKENIAIPITYITVGLLVSFPAAYIQYYPRLISASDSQLSTLVVFKNLPWSLKLFFGLLADNFPIRGYRFKPYMIIGYTIASIFNALIAYYKSPDIVAFALLLFGSMFGIIMADVMGDTLVASKARLESAGNRGNIQSSVYMCRFLSEMVGYWAGAVLCNRDQWNWGLTLSQTFLILAVLPLVVAIPPIYLMEENVIDEVKPLSKQVKGLWSMVQLRAVWQPLSFIVLYNSCNTYNAAWGNYLQVAYHFDAFQYGSMSAVGATVAFFGVVFYQKYLVQSDNWRSVYIFTTIVIVGFALMNVALVFHINEVIGIPAYSLALGDSAIQHFAIGIQYMPSAIIFASVCPEGQEGIAFALLSGFQNIAGGIAATLSNLMLGIWPVQLEDLRSGYYAGVWKLTVLSSTIILFPLCFVFKLLPTGLREVESLRNVSSRCGGITVIVGLSLGMGWVLVMSLLAITRPCLHIVGGNGC